MELAGLLITAGFLVYGCGFLFRWRRGPAAAGNAVSAAGDLPRATAEANHTRLSFVIRAILIVVLVALFLAALVMSADIFLRPACKTGVVITQGPHGEKIECVCVGGVQAFCFEPGP